MDTGLGLIDGVEERPATRVLKASALGDSIGDSLGLAELVVGKKCGSAADVAGGPCGLRFEGTNSAPASSRDLKFYGRGGREANRRLSKKRRRCDFQTG